MTKQSQYAFSAFVGKEIAVPDSGKTENDKVGMTKMVICHSRESGNPVNIVLDPFVSLRMTASVIPAEAGIQAKI